MQSSLARWLNISAAAEFVQFADAEVSCYWLHTEAFAGLVNGKNCVDDVDDLPKDKKRNEEER